MINYTADTANGKSSIKQHIFVTDAKRNNRSLCNQISVHNGNSYCLIEELDNEELSINYCKNCLKVKNKLNEVK